MAPAGTTTFIEQSNIFLGENMNLQVNREQSLLTTIGTGSSLCR
jgi:hypothetical protein